MMVGVFAYFLIFSGIGLVAYGREKKQLVIKQKELATLEKEIGTLEQELGAWKNDSFELEKLARQDLCMGYTDEIIYILPKQ